MSLVQNSKIVALIAGAFLLAACTGNTTSTSTDTSSVSAAAVAGSYEDFMANVGARGDHVYFAFNRYDLNVTSQDTLRRQANWLQMHPAAQISISGNCDERGTREYNLALGARRANSAKDFLVSLGVDPARVSTISYGKEQPECLASNEECWAINRNGVTSVTNSPTS
jgi:peptidoglycan-associated lipoprotein